MEIVAIVVAVLSLCLVILERLDRRRAESEWGKERKSLTDRLLAKNLAELFESHQGYKPPPPISPIPGSWPQPPLTQTPSKKPRSS